ncbi:GNAT family N-acetyltransferase [Lentzea sp. DG1S-22]|uniref:GNAT family N-acetyltransferase n=1 Tax=Lentzea sp. DG1S-22 TaxID=3108822 RepID=UPI002E785DC8|nr:GNAT family N-acetyltransferase [Lentzea sp. DG1S-22]WVH82362.1 GNAT family N-acetyltransferase [Lentzea sp. DG1S-22]
MAPEFEPARLDDIDDLLRLYRRAHGASYPIAMGTDPDVMAAEIEATGTTWLVWHDRGRVVASITGRVEARDRLGKIAGLVVDPDAQGSGIAHCAVGQITGLMLASGEVDSVYGTARTVHLAPQRVCLRNGFHPLGLVPNLFMHAKRETMTLLAKHRDGVLRRRAEVHKVPKSLEKLVTAAYATIDQPTLPEFVEDTYLPAAEPSRIEVVEAPLFVQRHFEHTVNDPARRFYPLHKPNVLLADEQGQYQIYGHLNRHDGYCTIFGATPSPDVLLPHLGGVIDTLARLGAPHVETLVPLHEFDELTALLAFGFLPVALYPAMRKDGEVYHDYVVMVHTPQPPDFRGLRIDEAFRPFTEQYVELWTRKFLNTNGVFRA